MQSDITVVLSGKEGSDTKPYQEKEVFSAITKLGGK